MGERARGCSSSPGHSASQSSGATALLLADGAGASDAGGPADWVVVVQIVLALLVVVLAVSQWRGRLRDGVASEMPLWMRKVDGLTARQAVGMAIFLASAKPKNLLLTVGAAVAIAELGASAGAQAAALAVFVLLGTLAPAAPLAMSLLLRDRSAAVLGGLREWMVRENATIVAVLCRVFAAEELLRPRPERLTGGQEDSLWTKSGAP